MSVAMATGSPAAMKRRASGQGSPRKRETPGNRVDTTPASAMHEANAKLMIRAMIMAAKADGEIDAEERQKIMDHLSDANEEEIAFVEAALDAPVDVAALAQETGEAMREQIYATSLMAITVDTPAEQAYLAQLGTALGLTAEVRAKLHAAMGKPAPGA